MTDFSERQHLAPPPAVLEPAARDDLTLILELCEGNLRALTEQVEWQQTLTARLREKIIRNLWPRGHATTEKEMQL